MLRLKLLYRFLPVVIILVALIFAGSVSFILANNQGDNKKSIRENVKGISQVAVVPPQTPQATPNVVKAISETPIPSPIKTPAPISSPATQTVNNTSIPNQQLTPTPTSSVIPTPQINKINVSINGSTTFTIGVNEESSQCDVLSNSLQDGKISSLNMKYDSNYNTYAVYQINGIGKENAVWWTYKVNGTSPSLGCSHVKAKNEDNVVWTYIGPN